LQVDGFVFALRLQRLVECVEPVEGGDQDDVVLGGGRTVERDASNRAIGSLADVEDLKDGNV
jgi:hypothetical protein